MNAVITVNTLLTPYEFEQLTVTTAVKALTASKYKQRGSEAVRDMGNARWAMITCDGVIRWRFDGTDPDATTGHMLGDGDTLILSSYSQIEKFRAYRDTGEVADAKISVSYLR